MEVKVVIKSNFKQSILGQKIEVRISHVRQLITCCYEREPLKQGYYIANQGFSMEKEASFEVAGSILL